MRHSLFGALFWSSGHEKQATLLFFDLFLFSPFPGDGFPRQTFPLASEQLARMEGLVEKKSPNRDIGVLSDV